MTIRRTAVSFVILAVFALWANRDTLSALCDSVQGHIQNIAVPCTGSSACADATSGGVPGNIRFCSDGKSARYWKAVPPTEWSDCVSSSYAQPCEREPKVCETVYLFKTLADCQNDQSCFSDDIEYCANAVE